ncbi:MAG: undecaprenyl/decaprenyl-phosphate alpha-N-acetylglucosaminyl 1-phosphate transferase [Actinobacteria bacterium]|jgi:UDP-GlcNAc:undecaprenyl-phosphate GlcNAc-1-phosphate transferase|nr:undecaprenyl/decaprenyl-phosphate alpha-N-acetylglucosaminyl 1-phosphate transferase [Actinomycetota bacterium]
MREYLVTVLLAAIITYLITPLVRDLAIKSGAVTAIRSRDVHIEPTPRWGGLAMWLAMALTLVIANYLPLVHKSFGQDATGIFLSGSFILFLGMLDDRFDLDPVTKFAGQALAAGILLIYGVQILWLPINGITTLPTNIGQLLTVLFVMVVINAINFVDGLDGLATGIVMICAASFFAFSYLLTVINGLNRAGAPSLITAVVIGLCLGFLPHNFHPAQIFMGDSGAMFLGLLISASAITLTGQVDASAITEENGGTALLPLLLPFTILAIPLIDFMMAILRRVKAGRSPFAADREHLHHRIMRQGISQQRTTIILYLWTAMFALPTVIAAFVPIWIALISGVAIFLLSLLVIKSNKKLVSNG